MSEVERKQSWRNKIESDVAEFLASGGAITQCDVEATGESLKFRMGKRGTPVYDDNKCRIGIFNEKYKNGRR